MTSLFSLAAWSKTLSDHGCQAIGAARVALHEAQAMTSGAQTRTFQAGMKDPRTWWFPVGPSSKGRPLSHIRFYSPVRRRQIVSRPGLSSPRNFS